MQFKKGDGVYYVDGRGKVSSAVVDSDERSGQVNLVMGTGIRFSTSAFNVFKTENAANRAALARTGFNANIPGKATLHR